MKKRIAIAALLLTVWLDAAAQSPAVREYNLGVEAYRINDYAAARQHWSNALENRDSATLNNLGYLLYHGLGGDKDTVAAVSLWKEASIKRDPESQWHLAAAIESGNGDTQNDVEAYAWYRCADATYRGSSPVDDMEAKIAADVSASIARIAARMPQEQRKAADELARQYIEQYSEVSVTVAPPLKDG